MGFSHSCMQLETGVNLISSRTKVGVLFPFHPASAPAGGECGVGKEFLEGHVPLDSLAGLSPPQCHHGGSLEDRTSQYTHLEGFLQHPKKASHLRQVSWFCFTLLSVILST